MYVLVSVSLTLGVTDGTPRVLKSFKLPANALSFLGPDVPVWRDRQSLVAVDITGKRGSVNLGLRDPRLDSASSVVHNRKWLVLNGRYGALTVWRLNKGFPEGAPRDLDVSCIEEKSDYSIGKLFLTHSQPVECIADGDELCMVTTRGCQCLECQRGKNICRDQGLYCTSHRDPECYHWSVHQSPRTCFTS
ncbi:hypothetical protein Pelo_1552 [Pelomyxa schiedti]|nr:hypothetical protein Pelo_1552 [Pelomyxa schiedti]